MEHGLGRKPSPPDLRDYGVAVLKQKIARKEAVPVIWSDTEILDQGGSSECVAYGTGGMLNCDDEHHIDPHLTNSQCHDYYLDIKVLEGQPGQENGAYPRDGLKVAKSKGWISAYAQLKTLEQIRDWLMNHGPVLVGTDWYSGMMTPDENGIVSPIGDVVGGHCWFLRGFSTAANFWSINSWGTDWGKGGGFQISFSDFAALLAANGEAWAAVQSIPAPAPKTKKKCWLLKIMGG